MMFLAVALALVPLICLSLLAGQRRAMVLTALVLAVGYWSLTEALGRPKPLRLSLLDSAEDVQLVAFAYIEGEAIFLWIMPDGETAPRAYALPWSQEDAESLIEAQGASDATGGELRVIDPLATFRAVGEPLAYAEPVPPDPPK